MPWIKMVSKQAVQFQLMVFALCIAFLIQRPAVILQAMTVVLDLHRAERKI